MTKEENKIILIAQALIIASLISLMTSPPLANLFETLAFLFIACSKTLRIRVYQFFRSTAGKFTIAFILILAAALLYGTAPKSEIKLSLHSWRRLLLLPMAAAVFMNSPNGKRNVVIAFFYASAAFVIYSYVSYAFPQHFPWLEERGVVIRNHATQTIFLSVSIVCGIAILSSDWISGKLNSILNYFIVLSFFINILALMTGRSGYIALLAMLVVFTATSKTYKLKIKKSFLIIGITASIIGILTLSPVASKKIEQAYDEVVLANKNTENDISTSLGLRVMYWKNTIELIPVHPFIGVGTGGFEHAYAEKVQGRPGLSGRVTGDPHNQYMKILVEQGVLGLAIFLGLLFFVARQQTSPTYKSLGLSVLFAWCITSLANAHFSTFSEGHFIWLWMGIMFAPETQNAEELEKTEA